MSEPNILEQQPNHTPLPDVTLDIISGKTVPDDTYPVVYANNIAEIKRAHNEQVIVPQVGHVDFSIDRRHYFEEWPNDFGMVDFQYNRRISQVATMQFLQLPDGRYNLAHRFVAPELRGKKVGEHLLAKAEAAFQTIANKDNRTIEIIAQFGQRNVLAWFLKHGYELADDRSRAEWENIQSLPEAYIFGTAIDDHNDELGDAIFYKDTTSRALEDTVRLNVRKLIQPVQR